jgi:hypothetical protein
MDRKEMECEMRRDEKRTEEVVCPTSSDSKSTCISIDIQ